MHCRICDRGAQRGTGKLIVGTCPPELGVLLMQSLRCGECLGSGRLHGPQPEAHDVEPFALWQDLGGEGGA